MTCSEASLTARAGIVAALSRLASGDCTQRVTATADPLLAPIVAQVNQLADMLDVQARGRSHVQADAELELAMLQMLVDHLPVAVFLKNAQDGFKVMIWNRAAEAIFEVSRDSIVGKTAHELWPKEQADAYLAVDRQVAMSGVLVDIPEEPSHSRTRGTIYLHTKKMPLQARSGGVTQYILCICEDITERKRSEHERHRLAEQLRQREKMDAIGQLAGGIAHDFNNQLGGIIGFAELLMRRMEDGSDRQYLQHIMNSANHAADLTRQLLAFGRQGKLQSVPIDIHEVVLDVTRLLSRSIDKRITIGTALEAPVPIILGDPSQIQNALLNLGLNARDAMVAGGTMTFSTEVADITAGTVDMDVAAGRYLHIGVADSGCGMSDAVLRRLFEPYFTTKEIGKGTGLGLASVYGTVQSHRGAIRVHSKPGLGSVFHVYLPMPDGVVNCAVPPATAVAMPATGRKRILIVDDEQAILDLGRILLTGLGYAVQSCNVSSDALVCYRDTWRSIDLVIMDMMMPGMNGRDLFLAMQAINPDIRVILASGYTINGDVQSIVQLGVRAFLQKPYTNAELARTVAEVLQPTVPPVLADGQRPHQGLHNIPPKPSADQPGTSKPVF